MTESVGHVLFCLIKRPIETEAQSKIKNYRGSISELESISMYYDFGLFMNFVVAAQDGVPCLYTSDYH